MNLLNKVKLLFVTVKVWLTTRDYGWLKEPNIFYTSAMVGLSIFGLTMGGAWTLVAILGGGYFGWLQAEYNWYRRKDRIHENWMVIKSSVDYSMDRMVGLYNQIIEKGAEINEPRSIRQDDEAVN